MPDHDDFQPLDLSDYQVHSRREIATILRNLGERKQLIQLQIAGSADSTVTSVLAVDDSHVVLDCAPTATMNQRIADSEYIFFETVLDNIRILFESAGAQACQYAGGPALQIALPPVLVRLQRRESYRVATPTANPLACEIHIAHEDKKRIAPLTLQNVSAGGVAILDEQKLLNPTIGFIYRDCRILLPSKVQIATALEIRNVREVTLTNGKTIRRLGCQFVDLPAPMLSAIQRYITSLEREQNARNTGML
jgi:flagellar brake protein